MNIYFEYDNAVHDAPPTIDGTPYTEVRAIDGEEVFRMQTVFTAPVSLIPINITGVQGAVLHSSDFTKITCHELTNLSVSGSLSIPDRSFAMPLRRDDGRLILFPVEVIDGQFSVVLNFPTSGQYHYSEVEANHDFSEPVFSVAPIKIDVLRQVTT